MHLQEKSPLKKDVKKQSVISKRSKLQVSNKSKDTSSSSNEVYSILENSLRRKTNKQTILTSKFKKKYTKENKIQQQVTSKRKQI